MWMVADGVVICVLWRGAMARQERLSVMREKGC